MRAGFCEVAEFGEPAVEVSGVYPLTLGVRVDTPAAFCRPRVIIRNDWSVSAEVSCSVSETVQENRSLYLSNQLVGGGVIEILPRFIPIMPNVSKSFKERLTIDLLVVSAAANSSWLITMLLSPDARLSSNRYWNTPRVCNDNFCLAATKWNQAIW